jgi:hypothetical protein
MMKRRFFSVPTVLFICFDYHMGAINPQDGKNVHFLA